MKNYEVWTIEGGKLIGFVSDARMEHCGNAYVFYHENNPIHTVYFAKDSVIVREVNASL